MTEEKLNNLADTMLTEYDFLDGVDTNAECYIKAKLILMQYLKKQFGV